MSEELWAWARRLEEMGLAVRQRQRLAQKSEAAVLARPVAHEGGDVIYHIDRLVEPAVVEIIESWPETFKPLLLVGEGFGADGRRRFGDASRPLKFRLLVDPIDGSRGLMYDKRPAWFVAGVAPDRGEATSLADIVAAAVVELPVSKQGWADTFLAVRGQPVVARRCRVDGDEGHDLSLRPSTATNLHHGFGQVVSFFPGTQTLAAELMERVVEKTLGPGHPGEATVFNDQYISSVGQMAELIRGCDRWCCDLRPLFYQVLARESGRAVRGLEAHPYDLAGMLVARQAGVILTDGFGQPLNGPLAVDVGVSWIGYANASLRELIEPVVLEWLAEKGLRPV